MEEAGEGAGGVEGGGLCSFGVPAQPCLVLPQHCSIPWDAGLSPGLSPGLFPPLDAAPGRGGAPAVIPAQGLGAARAKFI